MLKNENRHFKNATYHSGLSKVVCCWKYLHLPHDLCWLLSLLFTWFFGKRWQNQLPTPTKILTTSKLSGNPNCWLSIQCLCSSKQTSDENKEKHQLGMWSASKFSVQAFRDTVYFKQRSEYWISWSMSSTHMFVHKLFWTDQTLYHSSCCRDKSKSQVNF